MQKFEIKGGVIHYYGNPAGYTQGNLAIVDSIFTSAELADYLSEEKNLPVEWRDGVFDRLIQGNRPAETMEPHRNLKDCRIWQLRPGVDPMIRYINYDQLKSMEGNPEPDPMNYKVVFDGPVATNDLDELYTTFDVNPSPWGTDGDPIAISDIIELYDNAGSEFHYINRKGFSEIGFQPQQTEDQIMELFGINQ